MRNLTTKDVFAMSRIITKMDIKDELRKLAENSGGQARLDVGIDIFMVLLTRASSKAVENDIYEFLGSVLETTPEAVADMNPNALIESLTGPESGEWKDFFMKVQKLIMR